VSGRYAQDTSVPADRSRAEIERTLQRYGATAFAYGWEIGSATIMFDLNGRRIRFRMPMPDRTSAEFTRTAAGKARSETAAQDAWEKAGRQRWRALALVIKAKLEAAAAGITTVDDEFAMAVVLPDGRTVGEVVLPQIASSYTTGRMPAMLALTSGGAS